jgi:hypothetical protein
MICLLTNATWIHKRIKVNTRPLKNKSLVCGGKKFFLKLSEIWNCFGLPTSVFTKTMYCEQGCLIICFQTKIPIWVNVWWPCIGKCWNLFYYHLEHFTDTCDILWPFCTIFVQLVHFKRFWYHAPKKSGSPDCE